MASFSIDPACVDQIVELQKGFELMSLDKILNEVDKMAEGITDPVFKAQYSILAKLSAIIGKGGNVEEDICDKALRYDLILFKDIDKLAKYSDFECRYKCFMTVQFKQRLNALLSELHVLRMPLIIQFLFMTPNLFQFYELIEGEKDCKCSIASEKPVFANWCKAQSSYKAEKAN